MRICDIKSPDDIRGLSMDQLKDLAEDIRSFLISSVSSTGGHLSSNLGIVEVTLAMHYVFHSPQDKLIFDVGHQSYVHKILTGRAGAFSTLRQRHGLSGFQKRTESEHDPWEAGHSSTSLSAALGLAAARDLQHETGEVVAVIGDGALTGGMAMEALNDIGAQNRKVIIIFNDNNMSISPNHAGFEHHLTNLRTSKMYLSAKKDVKHNLESQNRAGTALLSGLTFVRDSIKNSLVDGGLFQDFNVDYLGPVNGHNIPELIRAMEAARSHDGPVVIHVQTRKGKGYAPAEQDKTGKWHGVPPFNAATGQFLNAGSTREKSWSEVMSDTLLRLARDDRKITAITPAMANGSKLLKFAKYFPSRFFDCGIAEEHGVTMAAGMAAGGLKPFISIYSSFLQRAYDQIHHDVARMDLPVVFGIDRAGLVGEDGDTHQGIYDIAFLRTIPNVILSQPKDVLEAQDLLYTAFRYGHPFFIRYPRGSVLWKEKTRLEEIPVGTWTSFDVGEPEQIVITYGPEVDRVLAKARANNMNLRVVNARFLKPVDEVMLDEICGSGLPVTVFETDVSQGSLSSAILEYRQRRHPAMDIIGLKDKYVPHGSVKMLRKEEGITLEDLFERLETHAS